MIGGGTLQIGNTNALATSAIDYDGYAGFLAFAGPITTAVIGGLTGSHGLSLTNSNDDAVALTVGAINVDAVYSGILSGGGSLTKLGTGKLTLTAQHIQWNNDDQ